MCLHSNDDSLTSDGAVLNTEKLGFVVSRDCGVRVDITGEHGKLGGEVSSLHPLNRLSSFE